MIKRRDFIAGLAGAAVWPMAARAQQMAMPVIGCLSSLAPEGSVPQAAFQSGLRAIGYVEGKNVSIEYRWARGEYDRLPELARELVATRVAVLATTGGEPAALAAKAASSSVPVVFMVGGDPVKLGLVASYNQPGGNATGQVEVFRASAEIDIEAAFRAMAERRVAALIVATDPSFVTRRSRLIALAARHMLPTMYAFREVALAGGLVSYGIDLADAYRQQAHYVGRILKGERPTDLPVFQPTKFDLVINFQTAKSLGLTIPPNLLAIADEVIE